MSSKQIAFDVIVVGSGIAGALIANELGLAGKKVLVLEAGDALPPNINAYMNRFYLASAKVPESPYAPEIFDTDKKLQDPTKVAAGRPTVVSLGDWQNTKTSYLVQDGPRPFASTYERIAGGTSMHWLSTSLRFVPNDFKMSSYSKLFVDWPIAYDELSPWYNKAEDELGVAGSAAEQSFLGITFQPAGRDYPMPQIASSKIDQAINAALSQMTARDVPFLGKLDATTRFGIRGTPAARNSEPYRNRRACAGNTNCIPICPIQAKYDPTVTLSDARNTGNVTIEYHSVVSNIALESNKPDALVKHVDYIKYEGEDGCKRTHHSVSAKIFVIAGNAIETPRLLLMSNTQVKAGVANSSGQVGRNLMDHPYWVTWARAKDPLYPYRGPLSTSGIEDFRDGPFRSERSAFRVDIGNEGWNFVVGGVGGDPNVTTLDFVNGFNVGGVNEGREALFGKALVEKLNGELTRQFRLGALVEQPPQCENRVSLSDLKDGLGLRRPKINYDLHEYTKRGIAAAKQLSDLLFAKMGATQFTRVPEGATSFDWEIDGKPTRLNYMGAGHIMGTYRMGKKWEDSVVNDMQRSHDHRNLYLVGSGVFPTTSTANPTLTIAALCLRTSGEIVRDLARA